MKPSRVLVLVIAAGSLVVGAIVHSRAASESRSVSSLPAGATRDDRWRQDLTYLSHELPRLHVDPFHSVSRQQFEAAVRRLETDIPALADHQIRIRLAQIIASVGDAHTSLNPIDAAAPAFPLGLRWLSDGLFITRAAPQYAGLVAGEVLEIGGVPVGEALLRVGSALSHENHERLLALSPWLLVIPDALHALGLIEDRDRGDFRIRLPGGDTVVADLRPISPGDIQRAAWISAVEAPPLFRQHEDKPFWFTSLQQGRTLYVRYSECRSPWKFLQFSRAVDRAAKDARVQRIIVDMRENSGGNSQQFDYLLLGRLRAAVRSGSGRALFALTDRYTFSSATANAASIRREAGAIIVGEASGMRPNTYGEIRKFRLPHSHLTVWYATKYVITDPAFGENLTLDPDIRVPVLARDYLAGRDPILDTVTRL